MLADFVDGADMGMIQRRGGTCLALKPFEGLMVRGNALGQELKPKFLDRRSVSIDDTKSWRIRGRDLLTTVSQA